MVEYEIGRAVEQRVAFGDALVEFAGEYGSLVVLDADVAQSTQTWRFRNRFPDRFYEVGIAEQNAVGIAAGLSAMGFIPFVSAFAVFLAHRAGDQIRNSVAYPRANVKLNGSYAGLPTGGAGATHSCFEDIAIMRSLPNMTVFDPADATEVRLLTKLALGMEGPVYLRTVRSGVPVVFGGGHRVEVGKAVWLKRLGRGGNGANSGDNHGTGICVISCGMMTPRAMEAVARLEAQGLHCGHVHMPCIKPIDRDAIRSAAGAGTIVTVENHSVVGGLGGAVAEAVAEERPCYVHRIGFQDLFLESGGDEALFERYGMSAGAIAATVQALARARKAGC
jgi:transketolase